MRLRIRYVVFATWLFFLASGVGLGKSQIHGRVLSTALGEPLSRAEVSLYRLCDQMPAKPVARSVALHNGEYELVAVKPGTYRVEVHLAGFATTRIFGIDIYHGTDSLLLDVGLEVGGDGPPSPERRIEGYVTDAKGKPLAEVTVTALTLHLTGKFMQVRTNPQGRYTIHPPAYDDIVVTAAQQGHQAAARVIKLEAGVTRVDFSLQ